MKEKDLVKLVNKARKSGLSKPQNRAFITYTVADILLNDIPEKLDDVLKSPAGELKDKLDEVKNEIKATLCLLLACLKNNEEDEFKDILFETEDDDMKKALATFEIIDYKFGVNENYK